MCSGITRQDKIGEIIKYATVKEDVIVTVAVKITDLDNINK